MREPVPTASSANMGYPGHSGREVLSRVVTVIALLAYPLSLTSPGATIALILVGLYGLALAIRDGLPADLRLAHRYMLACYLLVVVVDVLNGSIVPSLLTTGVDYLTLLALAPYAFALRRLSFRAETFDRAMQATVLIAVAVSCFSRFYLGENRPGGINLNSIPYSFVVATWGTFLLARGLEQGKRGWPFLATAMLAVAPVLLAESKTVIGCLALGYFVVTLLWAVESRRWTVLIVGTVLGGTAIFLLFDLAASQRINDLIVALKRFANNGGELGVGSFGERYQLTVAGWRAFLDRPILGFGFVERMQAVFDRLGPVDIGSYKAGHLHNDYITHLVSFGIFGLVFLVGYLVFTYRLVARSGDVTYQRASVALLAMLIIYMAAEVAFNMDPISGLATLAFGMTLARPARADSQPAIDGKSTKAG